MKTQLSIRCLAACSLLATLWWVMPKLPAHAQLTTGPLHFAIVMSKDTTARDISLFVLKRVFSGEPTEFAGHRLIPFNYPPEHPLRQRFDMLLLELSPDNMARYWIDRRIRGQGMAPRTVPTAQVLRAVVAHLPGAIGYMPWSMLDDSVVALTVDKQMGGTAGYPLLSPR